MSCITKILELKADSECLIPKNSLNGVEGGGVYKGHEYLITFVERGHRCGYVALHPNESGEYLDQAGSNPYYYPSLECHGGITFFDNDHPFKRMLGIKCDDFWVGFDAAHSYDRECMETSERYFGETEYSRFKKENPTPIEDFSGHRTYEYMEKECKLIIDQLVDKFH